MSLAIIHVLDISIWFSFLRKSIKFKKWSEKILIYLKWNSIFPRGKKRSVACENGFSYFKVFSWKEFSFPFTNPLIFFFSFFSSKEKSSWGLKHGNFLCFSFCLHKHWKLLSGNFLNERFSNRQIFHVEIIPWKLFKSLLK